MRFIFNFLSTSLFADEPIPFGDYAAQAAEGASYNYLGEFINMLLTLVLVIGLIVVSVWILKKIMRSRIHQLNRSTGIKILERRVLTPKSSLYLVNILGKGVVISESPAGIQLITEFSEEIDIDHLLDKAQEEQVNRPTISGTLTQKLRKIVSRNA